MIVLQKGDVVHLVIPGGHDAAANKKSGDEMRAYYASYGIHANLISSSTAATSITVVSVIRGYQGAFSPPEQIPGN